MNIPNQPMKICALDMSTGWISKQRVTSYELRVACYLEIVCEELFLLELQATSYELNFEAVGHQKLFASKTSGI